MARFVDKVTMFDRRSSTMGVAEDMPRSYVRVLHDQHNRSGAAASPESYHTSATLGQLFQRVNDAHVAAKLDDDNSSSVSADGNVSPHYVLELDSMSPHLVPASPGVGGGIVPSRPPPFVLKFTDLTYCVKLPKRVSLFRKSHLGADAKAGPLPVPAPPITGTKTLLDSISGEAREGEILAVLGASGSGKSTLIDALADRMERRSLQGSITLNGEPLESRMLKVISAYVMQDDLLYPMLTVEETLMFSAEFRLPRTLSTSKKKARVQELIDQLGLRAAAKTIIGDEGHRGVSGGERRRVSIGVDIIHNPILLFLDEPTSGLDSTSAFMVIKVLQNIAHSGSIVIMSVHQPSHRILDLLDQLLFLSRGRTVYNGPPSDLAGFFESFGRPIPRNGNPTEFALDLIRDLECAPEGVKNLADFNRSRRISASRSPRDALSEKPSLSLKDAISASISRGKLVSGSTDVGTASGSNRPSSAVHKFANPFWIETAVLAKRSFLNSKRTPELFATRLGTVLVTGFILATIFWRLDNTPKGAKERLGFFGIAMSTMFFTCSDALPVFIHDRYIFLRETAYNAYRRSSYVIANTIVGFPPLVLLSIAFALTTFFAVGLSGGTEGFIFFVLIVLASFWAGSGFVTFISGVVNHIMLGFTVVIAMLSYFFIFSGFFINRDRIHSFWIWFHYISLVKYPYEAVMQNEFDDPSKCFAMGVQLFDSTPLEVLPLSMKLNLLEAMSGSLGVTIGNNTCITTGVDILKQQDITQLSKWNCFWVVMAWGLLFRFLFYISLLLGSRNKRR